MKFKKDQTLIISQINSRGRVGDYLVGHDGYVFRPLPKCKVYRYDEVREQIFITDQGTFNRIKAERLLHESYFPYDKEYKDLEELKSGPN